MSCIFCRKIQKFPRCGVKLLALSVAVMGGAAWADTIIIPANGDVNLSTIYGTGTGQTNKLSDLVFNGTYASPSTLVVDQNPAPGTNDWVFDSANSAANRISLGYGQYAVIQVQDGIELKIRGANTGVVNSGYGSQMTFDLGNGSTLLFEDNHAQSSSTQGVIYSYSDVVFKGEQGAVVFNRNTAYGNATAIRADNANVTFEGNATFTNNTLHNISGGVIRTFSSGDIVFSGHNAMVIVGNNTAYNSGGGLFSDGAVRFYGNADIYGNRGINDTAGAIVAQTGLVMVTNGTQGIKVHDNYSNTQSAGAILIGNGAAYTGGSLLYAKNSDIQFYKNYTRTGNGTNPNLTNAVANAINIRQPNGVLNIAADAGRQVLFRDPITSFDANGTEVYVTVGFNTTNGSDSTAGKVTFTGEDFTAGSLSTQSRIYANTTVHGGVLELKDNAQYGVNAANTSFTLKGGATLLSTGVSANVSNIIAARSMVFANGAKIKSNGNSTLQLNATSRTIGSATTDLVTIETGGADQLTLSGVLSGSGKLQKTGTGILFAGNANQFLNTGGFNLTAGTLNAQNQAQQFTALDVQSGALLTMGSSGANLSITDRAMIAGSLSAVQTLYKYGSGDLRIANSVGVKQLDMYGGTLKIDGGKTFSVTSSATLGSGVVAQMDVASHPALQADTLSLAGGNTLDISGYAPRTDENTYTLVSTQNGISGDFSYTVAGRTLQDYVDPGIFLVGWAKKDDSGKNVIAKLGLVWNNTENNSAHGTFDVLGGHSFNLNTALTDNLTGTAHGFDWDGQSLTKAGDGLLALSAVNTYSGSTTINAGTLRTDIANTLASSSDVIVNGGVLDLNGNDQQANRLSGSGGVVWLNGAALTAVNATVADSTRFDGDVVDGATGSGRFIKAGDGSLTLAGQTGWTGDTWLNAGELILDGVNGGAQLTSNIIGTSGSRFSLHNGAALTGWIDPTDVDIDAVSRWNMTANSLVANLSNAGTIHVNAPVNNDFKTLTVQGNYTGNNGLIALNTRLESDDSPTDKLIVQGDTTGSTRLQIINAGGNGQQTRANGIEVISVSGQSNGQFSLAAPVVAGAYDYQLFQGDASGQGGNWYLRSSTDSIRPETGVYLRNLSAASTMFMHTLHDRLGEPQYTDAYQSTGNASAGWVRISGNKTDSQAANGRIDTDTDTALVHFGGDLARWSNNGNDRWQVGVMGAYGHSDVDASPNGGGRTASGKTDGYSVGAYATWFGNTHKPTGPYVDVWTQYAWYDNQVQGKGLAQEKYRSSGWTVSAESGYAFVAHDGEKRQWLIEPQAQIAWNSYRADDHREANGTWVRDGDADGVIGRLGARVYSRSKLGDNGVQPFIETNWWYSKAKNSLSFDGDIVSDDTPRNRYELKAGVQGEIAKGWQAWGHVGGQWGENSYRRYEGMVGVKKVF